MRSWLRATPEEHSRPLPADSAILLTPVPSEQGGERRPALVISNDGFNQHFDVVTVVPITKREGKRRRVYPFEVLAPDLVGTGHGSIVMPQQIRTISKRRLVERAGVLEDEAIQIDLENRLLEHLGIDFEAGG